MLTPVSLASQPQLVFAAARYLLRAVPGIEHLHARISSRRASAGDERRGKPRYGLHPWEESVRKSGKHSGTDRPARPLAAGPTC